MAKFTKNVWFKCIVVLLSIALVSGGILAILNQLLLVTSEERTNRAIKKIYGEKKEYSVLLDADEENQAVWQYKDGDSVLAEISKIYKIENGVENSYDLLFKSTGGNGYKNGTITLWVKAVVTSASGEAKYGIEKVILESYEKQTLMSKLGGEYYSKFILTDVTEAFNDKTLLFSTDADATNANPISGATMSANAGCNAVNGVIVCLEEKGWEI